jgi:flagellar hook-associated protein 3 FlgL
VSEFPKPGIWKKGEIVYFRVTGQMQANDAIAYMQQQSAALATVQDQLSSGIQLQVPSDNPVGYTTLAQAQTASLQYATYNQTITNANSTLSASASALQNINNILTQAKAIATQGADATTDSTGYQALATEVNSLISESMTNANSSLDGTYLFGGTANNVPPFQVTATDANGNPTAISYNGSSDPGQALIGPGQTVNTEYAGNQVFQQTGADLFQALINLRNNLTSPTLTQSQNSMSQALNQSLSQISSASTAIQKVTAQQSSSMSMLNSVQTQVQNLQLAANTQAGNVSSTDYSSAIVQMQEQETSLQASMTVASKILQPSLLNFIQ